MDSNEVPIKPDISIIIPVYNGESFIRSCYEALQIQSIKNWEAVFVNDGSQDNTYELLQALALNDKRLRVITQENKGVVAARENGIKNATADIITFLDIDDKIEAEGLHNFLNGFQDSTIDIVAGGMRKSTDGRLSNGFNYKENTFLGAEAFKRFCLLEIRWQLWAKAFRKNLFLNVIHPYNFKIGEDMIVCAQVILASRKVKLIPKADYIYTQHAQSVMHNRNKTLAENAIQSCTYINDLILSNPKYYHLEEYSYSLVLLGCCSAARLHIASDNIILLRAIKEFYKPYALRGLSFPRRVLLHCLKNFKINPFNLF